MFRRPVEPKQSRLDSLPLSEIMKLAARQELTIPEMERLVALYEKTTFISMMGPPSAP